MIQRTESNSFSYAEFCNMILLTGQKGSQQGRARSDQLLAYWLVYCMRCLTTSLGVNTNEVATLAAAPAPQWATEWNFCKATGSS